MDMTSPKSFNRPQGNLTRRQFIYLSALAAGTAALPRYAVGAPRRVSAGEKLNIAVVGVGGKGGSDVEHCSGENIVAICDVDESQAAGQLKKHPDAKYYQDWRVMLEKQKDIDAVIIATPDHTHAMIAATAMKLGKHIYCQKP